MARLIPWTQATGAWQMAADTYLLDHPTTDVVLRFYGWSNNTLSLGYHQSLQRLPQTPDIENLPWIRRPTGGRAVFHQQSQAKAELTYSLICSTPHLKGSRTEMYWYLCQFLIQGLAQLGVKLDGHRSPQHSGPYQHQSSCFATATPADLTYHGLKLVGSAQVWRRGCVLQQGTLLLQPDRDQWEAILPGSGTTIIGLFEILEHSISIADLQAVFVEAALQQFQCSGLSQPWTAAERQAIAQEQSNFTINFHH